MAQGIPVPDLLNRLAVAANRGVPLANDPETLEQLQLCRSWGFRVQIRNERIYLPFDPDTLVPSWIENEVPRVCWERVEVAGFVEADSTNEIALHRARMGAPEGLVVYAEKQTKGRGRKGRPWISRPGEGLCFSTVVRPAQPPSRWPLLTHVAGVALVRAVEELSMSPRALNAELKWPNDLIVSGRKAAGILIEIANRGVSTAAAVVGVGINVGRGSVPEGMRTTATSLSFEAGEFVARRRVLVRFLFFLQQGLLLFEGGRHREILELWKSHSRMWNGVPVRVEECGRSRMAVTCGLNEQGALMVRTADGVEETLLAADVSVRIRR